MYGRQKKHFDDFFNDKKIDDDDMLLLWDIPKVDVRKSKVVD